VKSPGVSRRAPLADCFGASPSRQPLGTHQARPWLLKAMAKKITWWEAAEIIGVTDRTISYGPEIGTDEWTTCL
jgi:hypothetical protein